MTTVFNNVGWKLLREQKQILFELINDSKTRFEEREALCGIVNLLDDFQDTAVDEGYVTEKEVFG
jgi:hypothetical protein